MNGIILTPKFETVVLKVLTSVNHLQTYSYTNVRLGIQGEAYCVEADSGNLYYYPVCTTSVVCTGRIQD